MVLLKASAFVIHLFVFLTTVCVYQHVCCVCLFKAVKTEVLLRGEEETKWHALMVTYYRDVCQDNNYAALDLPYHLELVQDKQG